MLDGEGEPVVDGRHLQLHAGYVSATDLVSHSSVHSPNEPIVHVPVGVSNDVVESDHLLEEDGEDLDLLLVQHVVDAHVVPFGKQIGSTAVAVHEQLQASKRFSPLILLPTW